MTRDGLYLMTLLADGRQISLGIADKPDGMAASDVFLMDASEKDTFLTLLARQGGYGNAAWASDGYALFSSAAQASADGSLSYADLSLSTLYLNKVLTFRMQKHVGRGPPEAPIGCFPVGGRLLKPCLISRNGGYIQRKAAAIRQRRMAFLLCRWLTMRFSRLPAGRGSAKGC